MNNQEYGTYQQHNYDYNGYNYQHNAMEYPNDGGTQYDYNNYNEYAHNSNDNYQ
jgi:hypothetical protein